jgi:hypothetical protein
MNLLELWRFLNSIELNFYEVWKFYNTELNLCGLWEFFSLYGTEMYNLW